MSLNLDKLEQKLDAQLAKETSQSLTDYFNSKREKNYESNCYEIWGSVPLDKAWAMNTNLYKEYLISEEEDCF